MFSKTGENNERIWRDFNHGRGVIRRESARQTDLIEQGGPMALLCARPKDLLGA
ncbi:MAG: hypothetical protein QOJ51_4102, partial [Acidobacteriaceae bacterium]|nr:hypothetical protein [Acidobacteriaceae bacterium]